MSRISTSATFVLFAKVAARRLLNQCGTMNLAKMRKKSCQESSTTARTGTLHRAAKASWFSRIVGLWLPITTLLGLLMFSMNSMYALVMTVALKESANANVLKVRAEDYERLQRAVAIEHEADRKAEIDSALSTATNSSVSWQSDIAKKAATKRFEESGLAGFQVYSANESNAGLITTLSPEGRTTALRGLGLYLLILQIAILCTALGSFSKQLTTGDPDLAWLWQFPVSRSVLFTAKMISYVFNNPSVIISWLYYAFVVWMCGGSFGKGLGLGVLFGISTAVTIAAIRLMVETILVQKMSRTTRGMMIGWTMGLGSLSMLVAMFGNNSQVAVEAFLEVSKALPQWIGWNPFSAGIGTDAMRANVSNWWTIAPAIALVLAATAVLTSVKLTAHGLSFEGESARVKSKVTVSAASTNSRLSGMYYKELLQMRRQPELIGQVVSAVLLVGVLMYLAGYQFLFDFATHGGRHICVAILVGSSYLLMVAAPLIMRSELKSLWMLQSLPRPLADLLQDKARVWAAIAMLFALPMILTAIILSPADTATILARVPFLAVAVWLASELIIGATALSASVTNEQTVTFKRGAMIAPTLAISNAAFAVMNDSWWAQISSITMLFVLNIAMRDRQVLELAWLSEPTETPPRRLYPMHGLLGVIAFQTLISAIAAAMVNQKLFNASEVLTIAYFGAAMIVTLFVTIWMKRNGLKVDVQPIRKPVLRPIVWGLVGTCTAGLITIMCNGWFPHQTSALGMEHTVMGRLAEYDKWFVLSMYVVAAPLFEEFLFRGMLYRTVRRSWGVASSVALTAVLFTTLHPVASSIGVFTLGVVTALVVEKTGRLWPSMIVHAGYNAMIWAIWFL